MYKNKKLVIVVFLLPALLLYTMNVIYPMFASIFYSLFKWDGVSPMKFINFGNYIELFLDKAFYKASLNTMYLVIGSCVFQVFAGLLLAVILVNGVKGFKFFRTIFFFPVTISAVSIALMFSLIYEPRSGLLNTFLRTVGLEQFAMFWLSDTKIVIFPAIFPQIWQYIGLVVVILLAALMGIPGDIIEYSSLDGLMGFKRIIYLYIPLTWEAIQICIVLAVTGSLKGFEHVYILTEGGPLQSSEIWATYMYNTVFKAMKFGYGSTITFVILITGFLFTVLFKKYFSGERIEY